MRSSLKGREACLVREAVVQQQRRKQDRERKRETRRLQKSRFNTKLALRVFNELQENAAAIVEVARIWHYQQRRGGPEAGKTLQALAQHLDFREALLQDPIKTLRARDRRQAQISER